MTEAEFLPLFDRYRSMVYGLALSYTRSPQDAEDICQEVFLTLLEKPPAPGKERPWLAKVTVNRCRDLLASPWKKRREEDDTALERLSFQEPRRPACSPPWGSWSRNTGPCSTCAITRVLRGRAGATVRHHGPGPLRPALPGQTTTEEEAGGTRL